MLHSVDNPSLGTEERLLAAVEASLNSPIGILAMIWALNLVDDATDTPFAQDHRLHAYGEGYRQAGRRALHEIRRRFPAQYQNLMKAVLDVHARESVEVDHE